MPCRGIGAGRLKQTREHRGLVGFEVFRLAVEIVQAGRTQPVHIVAEIGVGQVAAEDLVLGQPAFEPEGNQRLARLPRQRAFRGQESKFRQLLRDRAATAGARQRRACNTARIDTPVRIEPPVLGRQERLDHMRRKCRHGDRFVGDRPVARDRRPVRREQRDLRGRDRLERLGQRRGDCEPRGEHDEQGKDGSEDAQRPPALAPAGPVLALPPARALLFFGIQRAVEPIEPAVPIVVIERIMRRVITTMPRWIGQRPGLAPEGIEYAHRLLY